LGWVAFIDDASNWNDYGRHVFATVIQSPKHTLIVIVEDDVFERMGASDMFAHAGYDVLEAENAEEALAGFEKYAAIGLLFTDVSLPGLMSGSDLAHHVALRWPRVGIIMTSGRPRPEPLPANAHFHAKPYLPASVLARARELSAAGAWSGG
jgi:CheY-like chemotaxis protein